MTLQQRFYEYLAQCPDIVTARGPRSATAKYLTIKLRAQIARELGGNKPAEVSFKDGVIYLDGNACDGVADAIDNYRLSYCKEFTVQGLNHLSLTHKVLLFKLGEPAGHYVTTRHETGGELLERGYELAIYGKEAALSSVAAQYKHAMKTRARQRTTEQSEPLHLTTPQRDVLTIAQELSALQKQRATLDTQIETKKAELLATASNI